jgi:hypothetical protein
MTIPSNQLSTWTNQGGTTASSNAYAAINRALNAPASFVLGTHFDVFLQGSYRNATNIHGDSDIDVVCALNETFIDIHTKTKKVTGGEGRRYTPKLGTKGRVITRKSGALHDRAHLPNFCCVGAAKMHIPPNGTGRAG